MQALGCQTLLQIDAEAISGRHSLQLRSGLADGINARLNHVTGHQR